MTLSIEEMEKIIIDATLDRPLRIKGQEAEEFRKAIQPDIDLAEKNGLVIDIPTLG